MLAAFVALVAAVASPKLEFADGSEELTLTFEGGSNASLVSSGELTAPEFSCAATSEEKHELCRENLLLKARIAALENSVAGLLQASSIGTVFSASVLYTQNYFDSTVFQVGPAWNAIKLDTSTVLGTLGGTISAGVGNGYTFAAAGSYRVELNYCIGGYGQQSGVRYLKTRASIDTDPDAVTSGNFYDSYASGTTDSVNGAWIAASTHAYVCSVMSFSRSMSAGSTVFFSFTYETNGVTNAISMGAGEGESFTITRIA